MLIASHSDPAVEANEISPVDSEPESDERNDGERRIGFLGGQGGGLLRVSPVFDGVLVAHFDGM
jgi:hypothetical protein